MPATPVRAAPAPEPLAALLAGLDAFERFANQLDSSSDAQPAISRLASLTSIIDTFEQSDRASETKSTKDTLDQHGSELWNRSTTLHHALKTTAPNEPWNRAFALLRQTGYQLILLGGIEPYTTDFHVKLLSLSTKVALAFLALPRPSDVHTSSTMLSTAASHVALLSLLPPADRSSDVDKALLAFYTARIRVCVQEENWTVARWCMSKAKDLALEKSLSVYTLAALALKIGAALVDWVPSGEMQEEAGQEEKGTRVALAIQWLLEATELAEKHGGTEMDMMQTSTMEALAQAYLLASPPRSGWNKAEEVIVELLKLRPSSSPTFYRRLIKLMIARSGGDGEIAVAFASAAQHLPWSQTEGSRLLAEMHCLPSDRRLAKFAIIASLLDVACSRFAAEVDVEMQLEEDSLDVGVGPAGFVAQCLMAAVFTANDKDKQRVSDLFDRVVAAAPTLCITINPAFVCSTYLWRQGDKAHRLKTFEVAAAWYLLAAHPVLRSLEEKIWQKCFRKAALCYSEVAMYDEADAVISRCSGPDSAKNHFVRFYNATLKRDEVQAVNSLKALADATDLEVKMLLWAAKAAHESGIKPLLTVVLETLLEMGRRDSAIVGVDLVVLIRTLVRLVMVQLEVDASNDETINILLQHLETSLQLIKRIASSSSRSLLKDTTWLHKTAYNLCIRYATLWTTAQLIGFYSVAAHLAEFAAGSGSVEQETASIALHCRFASVSGRMQEARLLKDETSKMVAFNALVPQITTLQTQLKNAAFTHPQLDRLLELTNAVLALEVETFCAVKDWRKISQLFEELGKSGSSSAIDVQLLKIIAEKVLAAQDCPLEIVSSILQKTPAVLLARKDLKTESLAAWFRTIVTFALSKRMMEDAYTFMQSSVGLLQSQPSQFPSDELDWLIATAWDQGLDLFASSDIQRAQQWSSLALSAARFADSALESRLRTFFEGLCSRHLLNPAECQ